MMPTSLDQIDAGIFGPQIEGSSPAPFRMSHHQRYPPRQLAGALWSSSRRDVPPRIPCLVRCLGAKRAAGSGHDLEFAASAGINIAFSS